MAVATTRSWWIDAGNGDCWGQVLIGNADLKGLKGAFDPEKEVCYALPLPLFSSRSCWPEGRLRPLPALRPLSERSRAR